MGNYRWGEAVRGKRSEGGENWRPFTYIPEAAGGCSFFLHRLDRKHKIPNVHFLTDIVDILYTILMNKLGS
jgi:hypothetical protein